MSKIYDKYIELKKETKENVLYLFKYGIFFIFIEDDARIASNFLNLKLGYLTENIVKCGFPIQSLNKYLNLLKNTNYHVEIVNSDTDKPLSSSEYLYYEKIQKIVDDFLQINVDSLSISQAYDVLYNTQNKLVDIYKEYKST